MKGKKYQKRQSLTEQQAAEIYPLLDSVLALPFNKAVAYSCSESRADYLLRIILGERYRNAIESIETYSPEDYLYGRGLYYHIYPQTHKRGLIIAHVKEPPTTLTGKIIECAATKSNTIIEGYKFRAVFTRLARLRERYPDQIGPVYLEGTAPLVLKYGIPQPEEMCVVDIDIAPSARVPGPTLEQEAKARDTKKYGPDG